MRPVARRWESNDIETARRVVARAERKALEQAEQLRKEAEELLHASSLRSAEVERQAREEVSAEVAALRAEIETAARRATTAEGELARLHASVPEVGPDPQQVDVAAEGELRDLIVQIAEEAEQVLTAARGEADRLRAEAEARLAGANEKAIHILKAAEDQRNAAAEALREAEEELSRVTAMRETAGAELSSLRRQFAAEVAGLRDAMDVLRAHLEKFIGTAAAAAEAPEPQG